MWLVLLAGCADIVNPPAEDLFSDDVPDGHGERLTADQIAAEEAASGEIPIAHPAAGHYAWDAADAHAARFNPHRLDHGRDALHRDACLDGIARRWARRMASGVCGSDPICHRGEGGPSGLVTQVDRCWSWSGIGENVGYGPSEATLFQGFLDSPPHHANIDHDWNAGGAGKFGIGVFLRDDGRVFITHVFGTRR